MEPFLTIGQISKKVDLPTKTIRFYESIGLITSAKRAENGYRMYSLEVIEELSLIKNARDLGLPIEEIKKLISGCKDGNCDHTKEYVENEVDSYLKLLDKKIHQLTHLRTQLTLLRRNIMIDENCDNSKYCCNILSQLSKDVKGGEFGGRKR